MRHNQKLQSYRARQAEQARRVSELAEKKKLAAKPLPVPATAPKDTYKRLLDKLDADRAPSNQGESDG